MDIIKQRYSIFLSAFVAGIVLTFLIHTAIWGFPEHNTGIRCVSSPVNELTTTIQGATTGMITVSREICMNKGEVIESAVIFGRLENINSSIFACNGASVCKNNGPLVVSPDSVIANDDLSFKGKVECISENSWDFTCIITVIDP